VNYKILLEKFEGPLDLLLFLIKKNDIDICDIPISEITEQYMEYIEMMKMLDLDIVGDFLVMAATLMQIKSRMLLPPDPLAPEDQLDPRDELVQRLQEYQKFKAIADELKNKEAFRQDLFQRIVDQQALDEMREESKEVFFEASLFDLINALNSAIAKIPDKKEYEIKQEEHTIESKIHTILHLLLERPALGLFELFQKATSKREMVVTFVAILELIRLKEIIAVQRRQFDEIEIVRNTEHEHPQSQPETTA
jgi:segregation and condensation protein A